jgi:hypothetical protein
MSIEEILVFGRITERLLVIGLAGLSLWLGWKLFFIRMQKDDQTAVLTFKDIAIKLQKVAPGVMFALFGGAIMVVALFQNLKVTVPASTQEASGLSYAYFGENKSETARKLKAVNLAVRLAGLAQHMDLPSDDRIKFGKSAQTLLQLQLDLVQSLVTKDRFENWRKWNAAYAQNPDAVDQPQKNDVEAINALLQDEGMSP